MPPGKASFLWMTKNSVEARFRAKYVVDESGCWLWTASLNHRGYGQFAIKHGDVVRAHRYAWELANGPIPEGMHVLHRCDVRHCVKPEHLFLGTNADNQADMDAKARRSAPPQRCGEANNKTRLTEAEVREVREASGAVRDIGSDYGISGATVSNIKRRKTWAHVD